MHLMTIRVERVFIVIEDIIAEVSIFIWLKPLSHSAVDTAMVFMALMRSTSFFGSSNKPSVLTLSIYS